MSFLEDRIIQLAFMPIKELPDELKKLGVTVEIHEQGESIVIDNGSMRVGLVTTLTAKRSTVLAGASNLAIRVSCFTGLVSQ